jgi:hypothetical protein
VPGRPVSIQINMPARPPDNPRRISRSGIAAAALLKPVVVAGPANAAPAAQAALVSADIVRDFLTANGVNAAGGSADARAAVVRVICVRK